MDDRRRGHGGAENLGLEPLGHPIGHALGFADVEGDRFLLLLEIDGAADESGWIFGNGNFDSVDHAKDWHHADILYAQYEDALQHLEDGEMAIEFAEELAYSEGGIRVIAGTNWNDPSRRHFFGIWEKPSKDALAALLSLIQVSQSDEFTFGEYTTVGSDETSRMTKEEAMQYVGGMLQ